MCDQTFVEWAWLFELQLVPLERGAGWRSSHSTSPWEPSTHATDSWLFILYALNEWLKSCDGHSQCRNSQDFSSSRVIDVGGPDPSTLKLLEKTSLRPKAKTTLYKLHPVLKWKKSSTYNTNRRGYVALSHCWGKPTDKEETQYCTTTENFDARLKGFSIDNLPKTF
jgi:hypothetical protein